MKNLLLLILSIISCTLLQSQIPYVDIEGRLKLSLMGSEGSVHIGIDAGKNQNLDTVRRNIYIGLSSGRNDTLGKNNIFLGEGSGYDNKGTNKILIGKSSGRRSHGNNSIFVGIQPGYNSVGNDNILIGKSTGFSNTGNSNNIIGTSAGFSNTGDSNHIIGANAGFSNTGDSNIFQGNRAGFRNAGNENIILGNFAGFDNAGDENVFLGERSGFNNSGNQNNFLGYYSGYNIKSGEKNICLGSNSGPIAEDSSASERLYIDIISTSNPLIYGEFDNDLVRINGDFHSTGKVLLNNNESVTFMQSDNLSEKEILNVDASDHTSLNAVGDLYFNTNSQIAGALRPMTIKANKNVGFSTTDPLWKVVVKNTDDALIGAGSSIDVSNLSMVFAKESNDDNEGIGIGFQSSSDRENIGAAIVHERTGASSKGKLHFATKTTTGVGDDLFTRLTISDDGNVGLGITSPSERLHVNGDARISGLALSGLVDVQADNNGKLVKVASDARLKKDVEVIDNALKKVLALRGVSYNWKDQNNTNKTLGVIAQEVLDIVPDLVNYDGEYYGVNYSEFPALLIEAIKEQQAIIEKQQLQMEYQQAQLEMKDQQFASLLSRIERMEAENELRE